MNTYITIINTPSNAPATARFCDLGVGEFFKIHPENDFMFLKTDSHQTIRIGGTNGHARVHEVADPVGAPSVVFDTESNVYRITAETVQCGA